MNVVELIKFESFVLDLQISQFDNSSDCTVILTRNSLIIGFLAPSKELKWTTFKQIEMNNHASAFAISPMSRTLLMPLLIRLAYSDRGGIHLLSYVEDTLQNKQTILKGDFEVTTMSYNDDGMKLAFSGFDNQCHILVYQDGSVLSDSDSIESDSSNYQHCVIKLTSPGVCVKWHPTRNNYLVVSELNGLIRFLLSSGAEDEVESFICEYVINIGLKIQKPISDIDFIIGSDKMSYDFILASSAGLFLFALDKPFATLEKMKHNSNLVGNLSVKISHSWGYGSLLATVDSNHQLSVTNIEATRVIDCPINDCVSISWHKKKPILLAGRVNALTAVEFHDVD